MFGENTILGQEQHAIDKKGHIIIPKFTYVEENDILSVIYSENREYLKIFLKDKVTEMLNKMEEIQKKSIDNIELLREIQHHIELIHTSYCATLEVDKDRRIILPKQVRDEVNFDNVAFIRGSYEYGTPCVKVYKSKEDMLKM